jgi:acyl carrier protein
MDIKEFIENFAGEFDETPMDAFTPETDYKSLDEWNSLTALSIVSMVDEVYKKTITGADLRKHTTIQELADFVENK